MTVRTRRNPDYPDPHGFFQWLDGWAAIVKGQDRAIREQRRQHRKNPGGPYFTTYPSPAWYWFDKTVYGEFSPKIGNLEPAIFARLKGGEGDGASRRYKTYQEAMDDLAQAKGEA